MKRSYQQQVQSFGDNLGHGFGQFLGSIGLAALLFKYVPLAVVGMLFLGRLGYIVHQNGQINRCSANAQLAGMNSYTAHSLCENLVRAGRYPNPAGGN